jgi:murein DD-endopeptidase MepM/ murein hydrolase activator NlpD
MKILVKRGQVMGFSGMTGMAGGDHIHFSMQLDGVQIDPKECGIRTDQRSHCGNEWSCTEQGWRPENKKIIRFDDVYEWASLLRSEAHLFCDDLASG